MNVSRLIRMKTGLDQRLDFNEKVTKGGAIADLEIARMSVLHSRSHLWPGVPLALASAALFGATPPLSKLLLEAVSPFMLAGLLYLGAGVGLTIFRLLRRTAGETSEASLQGSDLPWLAAAVGMGGVVAPVLLMSGLALSTASSSALLLNLEGLATMGIAWLVFRENVDGRLLVGALAILAGAVLLSWEGQGTAFSSGAVLVAAACVAWGIDNNLTRKISATDPVVITIVKGLVAGSVNVAIALYLGRRPSGAPLHCRRRCGRVFRHRGQPRDVHFGSSPPRHGPDGGVLLACAFHRGHSGDRPARRADHASASVVWTSDGGGAMAASRRTPRPWARA